MITPQGMKRTGASPATLIGKPARARKPDRRMGEDMVEQSYNEPVRTDDRPGDGAARSTGRMEAFADAVFAIAFTLPLIEIGLPEGGEGFGRRLMALWPAYLGYALASLVIGIYWVHHHFSGAIYRTTGHYFNIATVIFLAAVGFIAFPARAFAENIADPDSRATGAVFFAIGLAVASLTWLIKWTVGKNSGHVDDRLDQSYVERLDRRYRLSALLTAAGAAVALVRWEVGLTIAMLVLLGYLKAPQTPEFRTIAPTVEGEAEVSTPLAVVSPTNVGADQLIGR